MGRRDREVALADILGVKGNLPASDYPQFLPLPSKIAEQAQAAILATEGDARERSINLNYVGQWVGGRALAGTHLFVNRHTGAIQARTHYWARITNAVWRPHISLHTHPDPKSVPALQAVHALLHRRERQPQEPVSAYPQEAFMLPSQEDIALYNSNGGGTVANIVSSQAGHFMLVRRQVREKRGPLDSLDVIDRRVHTTEALLADRAQVLWEKGVSEKDKITSMLAATALATNDLFVCYFSAEPGSPQLEKIHPE